MTHAFQVVIGASENITSTKKGEVYSKRVLLFPDTFLLHTKSSSHFGEIHDLQKKSQCDI